MSMTIAFIGLGNMGGGMAANLVKNGFAVRAYDLSPAALERASAAGVAGHASVAEAVEGADAIITMLPTGKHVESVYVDHVFEAAGTGALLLDCSTIDVATTRRLVDLAHEMGFDMADAPVSGGIGAATQGTLTFMVGAAEHVFARAEPILRAMGKAVIHAGGPGNGQSAKICNNMLLGATMVATSEAFAMAARLGVHPQTFYDIASVSSGQSWSMTSYCPVPGVGPSSPADNEYMGGFATALMLKDLKLALDAAASVGAVVPMANSAEAFYQLLFNQKGGEKDFSYIISQMGDRETAHILEVLW